MPAPELAYVLSGGATNNDTSLSLGGLPSTTPITDNMNNLFTDVSTDDLDGEDFEDYRCFYIFNDSVDNLGNFKLWIAEQFADGAEAAIAVGLANEIQEMTFSNVAGGTFRLQVDESITEDIPYVFDISSQAVLIQAALRELSNSQYAVVTGLSSTLFRVEWQGLDGNRKYPLLVLTGNNLTKDDPLLPATISFVEAQAGSPINKIAPDIGVAVNPPVNETFINPDIGTPVEIGLLKTSEGFPVWVRRTFEADVEPTGKDGLVIQCSSQRLMPEE